MIFLYFQHHLKFYLKKILMNIFKYVTVVEKFFRNSPETSLFNDKLIH